MSQKVYLFSCWKNYWTKLLLWSCNSKIVAEKLQSDQTAPLSPDKRATDRVKGQGSGQSLLQLPLLSLTLLRLSPADLASHASLFLTTSFTLAHPSSPHHPTLRRTLVITRLCSPTVVLSLQSSEFFLTSLSNHQSIYHLQTKVLFHMTFKQPDFIHLYTYL